LVSPNANRFTGKFCCLDNPVFLNFQTQKIKVKNMNTKELLIKEVENSPDFILQEVWDFLQFLKTKYQQEQLEISILSESSLQKDWLQPAEEEAWKNL
jgi:hypothetical protein